MPTDIERAKMNCSVARHGNVADPRGTEHAARHMSLEDDGLAPLREKL